MPSTYTLNNGIELIATGEQSGTWGDTTNVNLGLIDTALDGQVTVTLPAAGSSGSPNALAISDGSASDGRNRLIIFADGGDLGATAFVQLTPNDAEKIVYIRNNLSGGRAITLFQGTYNASNDYEVPAGTTAVVFFDGGGAGAVAANVFNNAYFDSLRLGGVSVTAILDEDNMASDSATALATQQSIKAYVDAQVGANNELSEVLANGNTSGGTNIQMTTTDEVQFRDTALKISSSVDGQLDIAADVELEIVAPTRGHQCVDSGDDRHGDADDDRFGERGWRFGCRQPEPQRQCDHLDEYGWEHRTDAQRHGRGGHQRRLILTAAPSTARPSADRAPRRVRSRTLRPTAQSSSTATTLSARGTWRLVMRRWMMLG
jgi:hypothetical protein